MGAAGAKASDAYLGAEQKVLKCSQLCCSPFATLNPPVKIFFFFRRKLKKKSLTQVRNSPSASNPCATSSCVLFLEQDEGMETPKTGQGLECGLQKYLKS